MKRYVEGADRSQATLFPPTLDEYIAEDSPVRVIDEMVEELELRQLGFEGMDPESTGRPAYHPGTLLRIYICGYLNRIQSSRRLERESQRNVELIWLTGRLAPDFKTIADFRRDNGPASRKICAEFVELCRSIGLFSQAVVVIDGSKFKAVNNRDKNLTLHKLKARQRQGDRPGAGKGARPAGIADGSRRALDGNQRPHSAFAAAYDNSALGGNYLLHFNTASMTLDWNVKGDYPQTPAYNAGVVYAVNNDPLQLEARSESDGSLLWSWVPPASGDVAFKSEVLLTNNLAFVSTNLSTYAVDLTTHQAVWSYPAAGNLALSSDGVLYLEGTNTLTAINAK